MVTKSPQTDGWSQNLRKMERRERLPENDKNNVAFYKKKKDVVASNPNGYYKAKTIRETDEQRDLGKTTTFSEKTEDEEEDRTQSVKAKSWSQIAGASVETHSFVKIQTERIAPSFGGDNTGYDRIVVTPTHFNNKTFEGFITEKEAQTISMAIGLKELENHHGTSFYRNDNDKLFITFRLKVNMTKQEIADSINKYFWFNKESRAGNYDRVSGQVVHPPIEDHADDQGQLPTNRGIPSGNLDTTQEVRIDGCNYEISESELRNWIELYGEMKSEIEEVALPNEEGGAPIGTGSYTVKVRLRKSVPNILPIQGLKVKFNYNGVKKQCPNCYEYHVVKREKKAKTKTFTCEHRSYDQYVELFKENNPLIVNSIREHQNERERLADDEESEESEEFIDFNFRYGN